MRFEILIAKASAAQTNMERDVALLESLITDPRCILHFYEWEALSATYGYFIKPDSFFDRERTAEKGLQLARRPTGGGITFHIADLAFSLLLPSCHPCYTLNSLSNYAAINGAVLEALKMPHIDLLTADNGNHKTTIDSFCMTKPSRYDLMWEGRKVGGAAQRRVKHGLLHQGNIHLGLPESAFLIDVLKNGHEIVEAMKEHSCSLLGFPYTSKQFMDAKTDVRHSLIQSLRTRFF